jgi:hypothetical protein
VDADVVAPDDQDVRLRRRLLRSGSVRHGHGRRECHHPSEAKPFQAKHTHLHVVSVRRTASQQQTPRNLEQLLEGKLGRADRHQWEQGRQAGRRHLTTGPSY